MNRGLGFLIVGILALLGGAAFAALLIKNKLTRDRDIDFDDFDVAVDDEEFEHFFGENDDEEEYDEDETEELDELEGLKKNKSERL